MSQFSCQTWTATLPKQAMEASKMADFRDNPRCQGSSMKPNKSVALGGIRQEIFRNTQKVSTSNFSIMTDRDVVGYDDCPIKGVGGWGFDFA